MERVKDEKTRRRILEEEQVLAQAKAEKKAVEAPVIEEQPIEPVVETVEATEHEEAVEQNPVYEYMTFPRQFVSYRWYKPLFVLILTVLFMAAFGTALIILSGVDVKTIADQTSYDTMDYYTVKGILMSLGSVSLILPSLWIATWIVRDRPVSSMSSSRGGWNWKAFFQCFLLAIPLYIASSIYDVVTLPKIAFDVKFSLESLAVLLLAVPIQCIAEEYLFRGFFAQTFASWTKIPWIGILVSTAIFAAMHPYSIEGIIEVAITGLCFGILAWRTKGLEASSAMHMMNNLTVFLMAGCGLSNVQTSVPYESVIISACLNLVYLLVILLLANRKWNWFTAKRDKLTKWNQKRMDKAARKVARKQNA